MLTAGKDSSVFGAAVVKDVLARVARGVVVFIVASRHCKTLHVRFLLHDGNSDESNRNLHLSQAIALVAGIMKRSAETTVKKTVENCIVELKIEVGWLVGW